jgi:hypothetical protein
LWRVKTRKNIHRGGIKIKINMHLSCYFILCIIENTKIQKNIEKEIFAENKNEKQSRRLWTTEA